MSGSVAANVATVLGGAAGAYLLLDYFKGGECNSSAKMNGKTVVITGCNTGIGKETARDLSKRGARIVMACRNVDAAEQAAAEIRKETGGDLVVHKLDLANMASIRAFAKEVKVNEPRIDVLINNAGVMMLPGKLYTDDGFEMVFGTNHLGPFLLTNLLLDKLAESKPARIVNVSSRAHVRGHVDLTDVNYSVRPYKSMEAYQQSKLANVLFTRELAKRLDINDITVYSLHPGVVRTELMRHVEAKMGPLKHLFWATLWLFTKNSHQGAQTTIYCAVDEDLADQTGKYYSDCKEKDVAPQATDDEMAAKLWDLSSKLVGL